MLQLNQGSHLIIAANSVFIRKAFTGQSHG